MRSPTAHPLFWLTLQIVVTTVLLVYSGDLEPQRVADTKSYEIAADLDSLQARLGYYRSLGYPLFLNIVEGLGFSHRAVPTIQLGAFFVSIYLLWFALWRLSGSKWLAYAAVSPLPWAAVVALVDRIQPDFLSASATIVAISSVGLLVVAPRRILWWGALILSVAAAYHLRPAAVFLVGFVPLMGGVFYLALVRGSLRQALRLGLLIGIATVVPYLSFCGLRWFAVGHMGLVSFGGTNLAGLAANFVSGKAIVDLPREDRSLARRFLKIRRRNGWEPMTMDSAIEVHFAQYSDNIWKVANPAGKLELTERRTDLKKARAKAGDVEISLQTWERQPSQVARNTIVGETAKALVAARPKLYFRWVRGALVYGLKQLPQYVWILGPLIVIIVSLPVLLIRCPQVNRKVQVDAGPSAEAVLVSLIILGLGYFVIYLLLVSLVSFPFQRYFQSMILFLPTTMCVQVFEIWRRIGRSLS